MIAGYNTDVEYGDVTYHVQTEDMGEEKQKVISTILQKGQVIASRYFSHEEILKNKTEDLSSAIRKHHRSICAAIKAGRIDDFKRWSETPDLLIQAAKNGDLSLVELLIERGAKVNQSRQDGMTPLMFACIYGQNAIVQTLLENGAQRHAKDRLGMTARSWAMAKGNLETAKQLDQYQEPVIEHVQVPESITRPFFAPLFDLRLALSALVFLFGMFVAWQVLEPNDRKIAANSEPVSIKIPLVEVSPETKAVAEVKASPVATRPVSTPSSKRVAVRPKPASKRTAKPVTNTLITPPDVDKQELETQLQSWLAHTNQRDIKAQQDFYMPQMSAFYLTRNVCRDRVISEKERVFSRATHVDVRAEKPAISFDGRKNEAVMKFKKSYTIEGAGRDRKGAVLQELRWKKTNDGWKISSERDLMVVSK
jgi:ketosteroid isomerase-like protein